MGELRFSFVLVAQLGVLLEVSPRLLSYTDVHVNATPSVRRTASAPIVSGGILVTPERYRLVTIGRMSPQAARYLELGTIEAVTMKRSLAHEADPDKQKFH